MLPTAEQSATFKQILKKSPETPAIARMATEDRVDLEVDEVFAEVAAGHDTAAPGSYVANRVSS